MLRHIVLFEFYASATAEQIQEAIDALVGLEETIPEILEWSIGQDIGLAAKNHDLAQVSAFADQHALERYKRHPEHIRTRDLFAKIADWTVVDYEDQK